MAREALYRIEIDGRDISTDLDPILLSLTIKQGDGDEADSLEMELDDTDGQIELPRIGAVVLAEIWWSDEGQAVQFEGTTDEPKSKAKSKSEHGGKTGRGGHDAGGKGSGEGGEAHSTGGRSKGRTLTLTASSADMHGKLKTHKSAHKDDAKFKDVATEWGQKAGVTVKVDDTLGAIERPYWAMANEHYMHWGVRMARELGATFKIFGTQAVFAPRQGGMTVDGQALQGITAAWGVNLIDWSISPVTSRPIHKSYKARHYDPKTCKHGTVKADADADADADSDTDGESGGDAEHTERWKSPDADHAKHKAGSNQAQNKRDKGCGDSVTIDGEPAAQAEAPCTVSGVRPGVDGTYLISDVTHSLVRSAGFTTKLALKQPSGDAGTDSRKTAKS